jgi:hypothetical protein
LFKQFLKAILLLLLFQTRGVGSVPAEEDGLGAGAMDTLDGIEGGLLFKQILKAILLLLLLFHSSGVGSVPAEEDGLEAGAMDSHDGIEGGLEVPVEARVEQLLLGQQGFQAVSLLRGLHGLHVVWKGSASQDFYFLKHDGDPYALNTNPIFSVNPNLDPGLYYNYKIFS